uniref:Putative glucuronoxylan glucuronosyltransferase F8H n=1 Tax=Noccaea caerulescens TaxID=107243 RepID=A0A1J3DH65_NOCCA
MFSHQKWKWCSWSQIATVASVIVLVSLVHLFLGPVVPSFDSFTVRQAQNLCGPSNESITQQVSQDSSEPVVAFDRRFPADLHGAVVYRNASWKAEIGQWLSSCDAVAKEVDIIEPIGGTKCLNDCSGQGVCNHEFGICRCFHGFNGEDCSQKLRLDCNYETTPEMPFGKWVVSICSRHCDTTRAMCFCGEGTKYPNRPVPESCGFQINTPVNPEEPKMTDWSKPDLDIITTNSSKQGWCNVDPEDAYASKVKIKEECDCKYDCLWGRFCEVPVQCTCVNQCSRHGKCRGGFCQCDKGWFGTDCSVPSTLSTVGEWPQWLRPAHLEVPSEKNVPGSLVNLSAVVKKKRPLIYIYDLPPDFNSLLLEGRHFKLECVNRIYDDRNATIWTDYLYGSQMAFYENILATAHRTLNGEEADFFFVPVLDSCIITRADDAPHLSMQNHTGLRSSLTLEFYKRAYEHIVEKYSYWNRSSGRDHIWFFSWDEGACYAPKEIWNSMMIVHWGNTNSKHNHSTTAYWGDNWDQISDERRGDHPCFDPRKDLVIPAWKVPDPFSMRANYWARPREKRKTLFYFNGNLGPAYDKGRPEDSYSMGIRQKLAEEFGSSPNKEGKLGKQHADDVIVTPLRADNYHKDIAASIFCGVFPGDGWSGRMEDSILQGCVPVIIQDGIYLPYENMLNYESFAVRVSEDDIPNLINTLRGFNETEIQFRLANVKKIWQRFLFRDSILLEAERQKASYGHEEDWAVQFSRLKHDDVFATFIQTLHYKLHNDPWRREQVVNRTKDYGLPQECLQKTI